MSIVAVAKKAGVSVATVSRVLNNMNSVRAETVTQVRAAMRELGYKPPAVKRGPKRGSRRAGNSVFVKRQIAVLTVGAFQDWLGLPVMASVVAGVMRAAKQLDVRAILDEMPDPNSPSQIVQRKEVDAAIVFFMSGLNPQMLAQLRQNIPLVWAMGSEDVQAEVDHVTADNCGAGQHAYHYLARHGAKQMAFITDHPNWPFIRLRAQSFANAAADHGLEIQSYLLSTHTDSPQSHAYGGNICRRATLEELIGSLIQARPRPDGLFVPTDLLLSQVYPLLHAGGIKPERDLRVISCDNEIERLSALFPRPASIDIRAEYIGRCAVRQLLYQLEHPGEPPTRILVAPQIALPPGRSA
jgi:DNA-binding LacI/PurR family transcriptional regulator